MRLLFWFIDLEGTQHCPRESHVGFCVLFSALPHAIFLEARQVVFITHRHASIEADSQSAYKDSLHIFLKVFHTHNHYYNKPISTTTSLNHIYNYQSKPYIILKSVNIF